MSSSGKRGEYFEMEYQGIELRITGREINDEEEESGIFVGLDNIYNREYELTSIKIKGSNTDILPLLSEDVIEELISLRP